MFVTSFPARLLSYFNRGGLEIAGWNVKETGALRKGCWEGVDNLQDALRQTDVELAKIASIDGTERVLDAGCGMGATSLYLAEKFGCSTVGITLHEGECLFARARAKDSSLEELAEFEIMDFTKTSFEDGSFDVVFAIESITWLSEKSVFLKEAFRLLRPGGLLVIADQFLACESPGILTRYILNQWFRGYSGFNLTTLNRLKLALWNEGFKAVAFADWTKKILPSSRILARHGFIWWLPDFVLGKILRLKGARRRRPFFASARAEFLAFRFGAGVYYAVMARKPNI